MNRTTVTALLLSLAVFACVFASPALSAQSTPNVQAGPTRQYVEDHHDTSLPLLDIIRLNPQSVPEQRWIRPEFPLPARNYPSHVTDTVRQGANVPTGPLAATIGLNFEGNDFDLTCNCAPPDTNGAVGTTQYVQIVNTVFTVYDKASGAVIAGPTPTKNLWSGFSGSCSTSNDGDGTVAFDKLANRWVFQQFVVRTTPYMDCVAVSQTSDATGAYNRYAFSFGTSDFPDYPKLGVWPDAYYESFNIFLNGQIYQGPDACAVDRTNMLTGAAARPIQCFQQSSTLNPLLPADLDGTTAPPANEPNFFMTYGASGNLQLFKYHVDFANPNNSTVTGPTNISVAAFTPAPSTVAQPSPGEALDTLSDRPMYRLFYRNFGSHESIGFNHSVGNPSGIRWYEIQNPNGTPTVAQQGTFAPDSSNRWMGSTAMDSAGDQAIGYSVVSSTGGLDPTVRVAGRTPSDPAGTMESELNVVTGTGVQQSTGNRWGDYSAMQVDPVDDCTFWFTEEYIKTTGSFNWATRVANFKFANCGSGGNPDFSISASPSSVTVQQGNNGTSTISTTALNGFNNAITLSASGQPAGVTVTFGTNPIPAPGTGTSLMTMAVGASVTPGTYSITVTGVGGGITHTTTVSLTVTSANPPDFSISASPSSVTVTRGSSGTSTISTAALNGFNSAISLSASGQGSRVTVSFSPNPIAAPGTGSSTMTIKVNRNATRGTRTITVTGTGGGVTHTTTVTLTIQ